MTDSQPSADEFIERTTRRATARAALKQIDGIVKDMEHERRRNRVGAVIVTMMFVLALVALAVVYLIH